jgi:hypothetical protein
MHKTEFPMPEPYLALLTVVPTSASTGATITEAGYTGYARVKVSGSSWKSALEGAPSSIKTNERVHFAACTGGTSIIKAAALLDSSTAGAGNMLWWTEVPEFTVSTTQTPAEAAAEVIEATLS